MERTASECIERQSALTEIWQWVRRSGLLFLHLWIIVIEMYSAVCRMRHGKSRNYSKLKWIMHYLGLSRILCDDGNEKEMQINNAVAHGPKKNYTTRTRLYFIFSVVGKCAFCMFSFIKIVEFRWEMCLLCTWIKNLLWRIEITNC